MHAWWHSYGHWLWPFAFSSLPFPSFSLFCLSFYLFRAVSLRGPLVSCWPLTVSSNSMPFSVLLPLQADTPSVFCDPRSCAAAAWLPGLCSFPTLATSFADKYILHAAHVFKSMSPAQSWLRLTLTLIIWPGVICSISPAMELLFFPLPAIFVRMSKLFKIIL